MTLPVSSYEELLDRVRSLTRETRQLEIQINSPHQNFNDNDRNALAQNPGWISSNQIDRSGAVESPHHPLLSRPFDKGKDGVAWSKEQGAPPETKEQEETSHHHHHHHESEKNIKGVIGRSSLCHSTIGLKQTSNSSGALMSECSSGGLSYSYTATTAGVGNTDLGNKVEMVYNLLSMLGSHDKTEMTSTLLAMSTSPDTCSAMRHSGCLSLLVQLIHSSTESQQVKTRASQALRNMVLSQVDDKRGRREIRVLRLLEQLISYCDLIQDNPMAHTEDAHPGPTIAALMKLSFDEEHRLAMCQLGGLYVIARLIQVEGNYRMDSCVTVKRYGGMALTNLTFGDGNNKALLCSMKPFMTSLVTQLTSSTEDLTQVTASVVRNLSWRADSGSKQALRDVGAVTALMKAAMTATKEPTLKSVLSALWNLSAHCNQNKIDICAVDGSIQYLVEMLNYQSSTKTLAVVENAGGILRNISSHIAIREDYRKLLRDANCLVVLLRQLQSASLTVVSNACGTLWNLSARCPADQRSLVALGAVPMLTSLAHSKHRMIAMGASAALKNLLPVRLQHHHQTSSSGGATLLARKKRALEAELNSSLAETCDNIEPGATWEPDPHTSTPSPQTKDECEQINRSVKEMTLEETTEQPVDYSLKYRETEIRTAPVDNDTVSYNLKYSEEKDEKVFKGCYGNREVVGEETDYAETDLDQLTNYSLRYSEEMPPSRDENIAQEEAVDQVARPSSQSVPTVEVDSSPEKHDPGKGGVVETPLMFSRCSSLGSLGSCEPANDDCQSSVVSEFSRMTSGILSPSDLPDSPSQTVPPSPRSSQPPSIQVVKRESEVKGVGGVFDDTVVNFKEESTPVQFSTATSLSDLTILSDEPNMMMDGGADRKELELPVVSEEEDEDVLANCIKVGMQDNRDRVECGQVRRGQRCGIPVKASPQTNKQLPTSVPISPRDGVGTTKKEEPPLVSEEEDEDLLANCIKVGMQDNRDRVESALVRRTDRCGLPVKAANSKLLSQPPQDVRGSKKKEGPPYEEEDEDLLANCIKVGMQDNRDRVESALVRRVDRCGLPVKATNSKLLSQPPHDVGGSKKEEPPLVSEEEDEDLLANCIKVGMQDNRDRVESALVRRVDRCGLAVKAANSKLLSQPPQDEERPVKFCTEDTPASLSHATSHSELSSLMGTGSDDDQDNILQQCIQSARPQVCGDIGGKKAGLSCNPAHSVPVTKVSVLKTRLLTPQSRVKEGLTGGCAEDELSVFATEDTPCNFSIGSSLSDLTINTRPNRSVAETPPVVDHSSPLSSLEPDVSVDEGETVTVLSNTSADEVTLRDQEEQSDRAILMQAISAGISSVSEKKNDSWPDDTTISLSSHSFSGPRDGVVELDGGGVALISHLELESVEPRNNLASTMSLGGSVGPASLGLDSLDAVEPPSLMNSILSNSSINNTFLDHVKPPAEMDELIDLDNSMASCASLTSELADDSRHHSLSHHNSNHFNPELSNSTSSHFNLDSSHFNLDSSHFNLDSSLFNLDSSLTSNHSSLNLLPSSFPTHHQDLFNHHKASSNHSSLNYQASTLNHHDLTTSNHSSLNVSLGYTNGNSRLNQVKDRHQVAVGPFRMDPVAVGDYKDCDTYGADDHASLDSTGLDENRFNTFVVKERRDSSGGKSEEDMKPRERGKQRRQMDKDRFLTRTIQEPVHDIERLCSVESDGVTSSTHSADSESTSDNTDDPPRPIVVKPPEVKSIRGGAKSSIPVVRSPVKSNNSAANKKKSAQVPGALPRQGTFTKDEPSSNIPVPVKKSPAPTTVKKSPHNVSGIGRGRASSLPSKAASSGGVRASSSNQSLKSAAAAGGGGGSMGGGGSSQPRWHSNTSLNRPPSSSPSPPNPSRIASLWKRVDDSKKKQNLTKDTRLWIPPDPAR